MYKKKSKLYNVWVSMRRRCNSLKCKEYKFYGERGIKVCEEWNEFVNFKEWSLHNGYEEGLSIDRVNNDGSYEPNNCRWVTQKIQNNNTRQNTYVTIDGITKTLSEWADYSGVNYSTIRMRVRLGWEGKKVIEKPEKAHEEREDLNQLIEYNGELKSIRQIAKENKINYTTLIRRLDNNCPLEELFRKPRSGKPYRRQEQNY